MYKIVFATNNAHKLREIREILAGKAEVMSLKDINCFADIPETADTLEGNALIKARYVYDRYALDCFADDTGLEVDALGGAPGVHTARYAGDNHDTTANMRKLLREMQGKTNRSARFRTAIALIQGGQEHLFSGVVEGEIATEPRGEQGFGYDPVFIPYFDKSEAPSAEADASARNTLTFAQMGEEAKNHISHRARAVAKLLAFLQSQVPNS